MSGLENTFFRLEFGIEAVEEVVRSLDIVVLVELIAVGVLLEGQRVIHLLASRGERFLGFGEGREFGPDALVLAGVPEPGSSKYYSKADDYVASSRAKHVLEVVRT